VVVSSAPGDRFRVRKVTAAAHYLAALGLAVRQQRENRGLSQEALALQVDLDRTYVSGIERGIRNPTVATLLRLTKALGVPPSALLKAAEKAAK